MTRDVICPRCGEYIGDDTGLETCPICGTLLRENLYEPEEDEEE